MSDRPVEVFFGEFTYAAIALRGHSSAVFAPAIPFPTSKLRLAQNIFGNPFRFMPSGSQIALQLT
jgi:hypothetical protein